MDPACPDWLRKTPICHRGLFTVPGAPENSLAAFESALAAGLPIELDVRLLANGEPVVFHDRRLVRMTGRRGTVSSLSRADLDGIRLLGTKERIPRLEEVLDLVQGKVPLLIELKNLSMRIGPLEQVVLDRLSTYAGDYALQSFNALSLIYLRRHAPSVWRGQLSAGWMGIPLAGRSKPHFLSYNVQNLQYPAVQQFRQAGFPVLAWTVRSKEQLIKTTSLADNCIFELTDQTHSLLE